MRSVSLTLPLVVAGVLVLTACGTQRVASSGGGSPRAEGADSADPSGTASCGARSSDTWVAPSDMAPPGSPSGLEKDGVRITGFSSGSSACAEFEVTNHGAEPFTYTIAFAFLPDSGREPSSMEQTVPSVAPGRSVKRVFAVDAMHSHTDGKAKGKAGVRITKVRSVPTAEAAPAGGACPLSGVSVYVDKGDAAMGLRAVGLHLRNCGTQTYRLNGYPQLQILDEGHKPVSSVKVLHGGSAITASSGADGVPQQLVLKPGESAYADMVWRNTYEAGAGDPVNAPYVRVWAKPGAAPMTVIPELDLGSTGKLGVGPWKRDDTMGPVTGGTSGRPAPPSLTAVPR
ncbi:DUF4232 domain-containing protein [Streptomyces sp. SID13666]|nr:MULTISPECIES: DUF4232 domain-containing protein [unclassified Streptomyces]NEA56123.1 DUF4232 domain-containing protein [Streptomyces sp. SID13666]NEA71794.1 DUF4232 domain-containing protein [Streptomyces sp. SID13588]